MIVISTLRKCFSLNNTTTKKKRYKMTKYEIQYKTYTNKEPDTVTAQEWNMTDGFFIFTLLKSTELIVCANDVLVIKKIGE